VPLFTPLRDMSSDLFNNLDFFFFSLSQVSLASTFNISRVRHRDTQEAPRSDNFKHLLFFFKCNIYSCRGTCTPRVLLHIADSFLHFRTKNEG